MEKRYPVFLLIVAVIWFAWLQYIQANMPKRKPGKDDVAAVKSDKLEKEPTSPSADAKKTSKTAPETQVGPQEPDKVKADVPKPEEPKLRNDVVLGKLQPKDAKGKPDHAMYVELTNKKAAVTRLVLNNYEDERRKTRFQLLGGDEGPDSFEITRVWSGRRPKDEDETGIDTVNWDVVKSSPTEAVFRTTALGGKLQIEKHFTLVENQPVIELDVVLKNLTAEKIDDVSYEMTGGNGLPIEGKWYTRYYRNMVAVMVPANGGYPYFKEQYSSSIGDGTIEQYSQTPLQFVGITSQYFASLVVQEPDARQERLIASATPIDFDESNPLKKPPFHNIGVRIVSSPTRVKEDDVVHSYILYNGPKDRDVLQKYSKYHLEEVIHYNDFLLLPIGLVARSMVRILEFLHSLAGDYGVAIILLTVVVRGCMFPLSFKQTMSMQKMQALQPQMQELKERYANDKEKYGHEVMELYRRAGVNPMGGCLPLLLQFPIFVGLWQSLSNSFSLRQTSFLYGTTWINDLAAPDQLFAFPIALPWLGPYFNLLPILAVIQMILQAKFMSPPATSPEMELQKKMMNVMMIVFGFIFYNFPSGLCIYIITSGAWSLAERKLLPKPKTLPPPPASTSKDKSTSTPNWKAEAMAKMKKKRKKGR